MGSKESCTGPPYRVALGASGGLDLGGLGSALGPSEWRCLTLGGVCVEGLCCRGVASPVGSPVQCHAPSLCAPLHSCVLGFSLRAVKLWRLQVQFGPHFSLPGRYSGFRPRRGQSRVRPLEPHQGLRAQLCFSTRVLWGLELRGKRPKHTVSHHLCYTPSGRTSLLNYHTPTHAPTLARGGAWRRLTLP